MFNLKNTDIYLSRLVSALCLFWILAEANVWLDPVNNVILVLGYRLFILLTPLFFMFFRHKLTFIASLILELGIALWLLNFVFLGTVCFAVGISISGYMLKYYSVFSTKGAAGNKIALNLGSVLSGCMVSLSQNKTVTLIACFILMTISVMSFVKYYIRVNLNEFPSNNRHFQFNTIFTAKGMAWALIGFVIGVKLISIVSILPQFAINGNHGNLPSWYGLMLILNSILVVALQMPIMNWVSNFSKSAAIIPLMLGMIIVLFSNNFYLDFIYGAFIWTLSLSIIECCVSYLDKLSQDDDCLLIKESCVGLGSALTVFFVRFFSPQVGSMYIGAISVGLLIVSLIIFYGLSRQSYSDYHEKSVVRA